MAQQTKWKEKIVYYFFEEEDEQVKRDPNVITLELTGWKSIGAFIGLVCIASMTVFSYVYVFTSARTVEKLCTIPLEEMSGATRGGAFEVGTSKGPMLVILEPMEIESTTHRYLTCTVPNIH